MYTHTHTHLQRHTVHKVITLYILQDICTTTITEVTEREVQRVLVSCSFNPYLVMAYTEQYFVFITPSHYYSYLEKVQCKTCLSLIIQNGKT